MPYRPRRIAEAIHAGNTRMLRMAGRAGAKASAVTRKKMAVHKDLTEAESSAFRERKVQDTITDFHTRKIECNEYIAPVDGDKNAQSELTDEDIARSVLRIARKHRTDIDNALLLFQKQGWFNTSRSMHIRSEIGRIGGESSTKRAKERKEAKRKREGKDAEKRRQGKLF